MITTSADYKTEVWTNDNRQFLHYAVVTLTDNTVINLDNTNIWQGGFRLEEAVSSTSSLDVGSCIASELTLIINNIDGDYDGVDFEGASVVTSLGLMINGIEERFQRGVYFVDEMEYTGSLITLTCLDAMVLFDKDYSLSTLAYPAALMQIVSDVCAVCGVALVSNDFPNSSYVVKERPDTDTLTCREVLSCALQIGCSYGHINPLGELEISSYELGVGSTSTWNDIGSLTWDGLANFTWNALPYPTGESFNGGTFWTDADSFDGGTFWTDADSFDGGAFLNLPEMDFTLTGYSSFKVDFRRCTFTGVEVIVGDNSVLAGNDTYVLKVENNVLVNDPATVASLMRPYILGLTFWPYEAEHLSDPSLQAGDSVLVIDRKGNEYRTFATNISYSAGNYETTGCYAQSYPRNVSNRYSSAAVAEARAVSTTNKYIDLMANSFGLYRSEIPDPVIAGAYTYALHNASTYDASTFAMIANAEGLYMQSRASASDEWTTTASVASDGDALVNVLTAIGIKAGWVKIGGSGADGTLYIYDTSDNVIGEWGADGIKIYEGAFDMVCDDPDEDIVYLEWNYDQTTAQYRRTGKNTATLSPNRLAIGYKQAITYSGSGTVNEERYCDISPIALEAIYYGDTDYAATTSQAAQVRCEDGTMSGGTATPSNIYLYTSTGARSGSDARLKENIKDAPDLLDFILSLRAVSFNYRNREEKHWGFIAQEVLEAEEGLDVEIVFKDEESGYYTLDYTALVPVLTKAIQEQQAKIDDLEARLKALEACYLDDGR